MAKKDGLSNLLLLGGLAVAGYFIYKQFSGQQQQPVGYYSMGWIPGDATPKTPTNQDENTPTATPKVAATVGTVAVKMDDGTYGITTSQTAPLTNKRVVQGVGEILVDQGKITQTTPVIRTTDIIKNIIGVQDATPKVSPTEWAYAGSNIQPLSTVPQLLTTSPTAPLTNKRIVQAVGTYAAQTGTITQTTPVIRTTDILKGLIKR